MPDFDAGLSQWERRLMGRKQESISSVADLIEKDENIFLYYFVSYSFNNSFIKKDC